MLLNLALMFAVPVAPPVASPVAFTVAIDVFDEVHRAMLVTGIVPPSLRLAVDVNCWVVPLRMSAVFGLMRRTGCR